MLGSSTTDISINLSVTFEKAQEACVVRSSPSTISPCWMLDVYRSAKRLALSLAPTDLILHTVESSPRSPQGMRCSWEQRRGEHCTMRWRRDTTAFTTHRRCFVCRRAERRSVGDWASERATTTTTTAAAPCRANPILSYPVRCVGRESSKAVEALRQTRTNRQGVLLRKESVPMVRRSPPSMPIHVGVASPRPAV
jgi:hypothetical protein